MSRVFAEDLLWVVFFDPLGEIDSVVCNGVCWTRPNWLLFNADHLIVVLGLAFLSRADQSVELESPRMIRTRSWLS